MSRVAALYCVGLVLLGIVAGPFAKTTEVSVRTAAVSQSAGIRAVPCAGLFAKGPVLASQFVPDHSAMGRLLASVEVSQVLTRDSRTAVKYLVLADVGTSSHVRRAKQHVSSTLDHRSEPLLI